jgi:hypothetical protein
MKRFIFMLLTLSLSIGVALAQSQTGVLSGTVSDASGIIPGATVVVTDNQSGKEKTIVTTDSGTFSVSQLEVGIYTVKITAANHKTYTATDVKIDVGKDYSLTAVLEVGNITENVTVVAGADIINSSDGQLATSVSPRQIVELPLNGRNPLSLVLLQAGTSSNSSNSTTINGQRSSFTNITRDGINVQDNFIRSNAVDFIPDRPNVDDTGEFTIITQNAGAEAGYGSSQVQLVTPRGSNEFHGAAFIYNRNSKFSANTFFNNFSKVPKPFLNRNQFGGKIGGPILKNRFFFFGAYEGFRLRQSTTVNRTILLPSARTGIFTFRDNAGVVRNFNIFTLAAGLAGTPPTGIDPAIASRIIANLPATGNNATLGDQFNTTGLTLSRANNQDREGITTRFDYEISSSQAVKVVYSFKKELLMRNDLEAQQGGAACCYTTTPSGFQDAHTKFLALSWRWSPVATLTNEVSGGWQRSDPAFGVNGTALSSYLVVPLINNTEVGFDPQGRDTDIYNAQDNAVWDHGSHSVHFGGQFQAFKIHPFGPGAFGASYLPTYTLGGGATPGFTVTTFNAASGCVAATGVNCISSVTTANSLLALLGGLVGTVSQTFTAQTKTGSLSAVPPLREIDFDNYSGYVSDQWRATPKLSLNIGLRYDLFSPIREANGLILEPVLAGRDVRTAILDPTGTYDFVGVNGNGKSFFKWDKNNFAPIVSFAYSPTFKNNVLNKLFPGEGRTVLRGGYRRSFVNDEWSRAADNALLGNAGLTSTLSGTGNFRVSAPPTIGAPALVVPRTYTANNAQAANFGTVFAIDPDIQVPSSDEFNIGIEREIGWQTALEVRYVHGQSNSLVRGLDLNQVKIFNNGFLADFNRARNNIALYGSGQVNCVVSATRPACQPLQLLNQAPFNNSAFGNPLGFSNTINPILAGDVGQLAFVYLSTFGVGNSQLLNNPNTGVVDLLTNAAKYRYDALQMEVRRRFNQGLTFQANYTFQKTLTDAPGTGQTRFEPLIDNALGGDLEYARADYDTAHVFNLNGIYELPFGRGKAFGTGAGPWLDRLIGGWQFTSIVRMTSGTPFTIADPRGTLNRAGRSGRQTANTNLSKEEVRKLLGVFRLPCGIFFINPDVINIDLSQCNNGVVAPRVAGTTAGVASLGFDPIGLPGGVKTFPGQVFFSVAPGQTGTMDRNWLVGPMYVNVDASIIKNIRITEGLKFQVRGEAFNLMNRSIFFPNAQFASINSSTFGRLQGTFGARIVQFVGRFEF